MPRQYLAIACWFILLASDAAQVDVAIAASKPSM